MTMENEPQELRVHLENLRIPDCCCLFEYHVRDVEGGWVQAGWYRRNTNPMCPVHGGGMERDGMQGKMFQELSDEVERIVGEHRAERKVPETEVRRFGGEASTE